MLFDISRHNELRPWLVSNLEPICDADPEVLADYVLALLRHDGDERSLQEMFTSQLDDFLDNQAPAFVDSLFVELNSKNMFIRPAPPPPTQPQPHPQVQPIAGPSNPPQGPSLPTPPDEGIPIPLDMFGASSSPQSQVGQKRGRDADDMDTSERAPPKGPRLGNGLQGIQRYESRNQNGDQGNWGGQGGRGWRGGPGQQGRGRGGRGRGGGGQGGGGRLPCRDFHERGFCSRGLMCPYSHGEEMAFVPPMMPFFMPGLMPGMPGMMPGMQMPMPGPNGEMPFPMMPGMFGGPMQSGEGAKEYDPSQAQMPVSPIATAMMAVQGQMGDGDQSMDSGIGESNGDRPIRGRGRGGARGRGRGRSGEGGIPPGERGFRPSPDDKTLLVEKIPPEHLSMNAINEQFKKHGAITNIAVDARGAKAMVTFASHDEAQHAWRDPEPVFGSRFVKVLWHRPLEGKGAIGQQMLDKSKVLVENMNKPKVPAPAPAPAPAAAQAASDALAARSQLIDKHLAEQKTLMGKLEQAKTPQEKKEIMMLIKKNDQQMAALKSAPVAAPAPAAAAATVAAVVTGGAPASREAQLKERLDKELDLQNTMDEIKDSAQPNPDLLAQLAKLREEARNVGVPLDASGRPIEPAPSAYAPGYSRPYRGRGRGGRGRGGFRGGAPVYHQSMKLDLRPKKLVVKGVNVGDEDAVAAVRNFYMTSGGMEAFEVQPGGEIHVQFFSRGAAEQALSKGSSIPSAEQASVGWPTVISSSSQGAPSSAPADEGMETSPADAPSGSFPGGGSTQESQEVEHDLAASTQATQDPEQTAENDDPWNTSQDIVVDE